MGNDLEIFSIMSDTYSKIMTSLYNWSLITRLWRRSQDFCPLDFI